MLKYERHPPVYIKYISSREKTSLYHLIFISLGYNFKKIQWKTTLQVTDAKPFKQ